MSDQMDVQLCESIIRSHDGAQFESLSRQVADSEKGGEDPWFTEECYQKVCDEVGKQLGAVERVAPIGCVQRADSILTLWKVHYSQSTDEVLWMIAFAREDNKITELQVQWPHDGATE